VRRPVRFVRNLPGLRRLRGNLSSDRGIQAGTCRRRLSVRGGWIPVHRLRILRRCMPVRGLEYDRKFSPGI